MAKAGKGKLGKGKAKGAAKPAKKPAAKRTPKSKPARTAKPARGGYEIICSECYADFQFNPGSSGRVTCPECMHVGQVAEADVMGQIGMSKKREAGAFMKAAIPAALFLLCGFVWIVMLTKGGNEPPSSGVNYGFLGAGSILFIVMVAMAAKYESSRYEVYF